MTERKLSAESHRFYSRPADRSLEAYKRWMRAVLRHLGVPDDLTDACLAKGWQEFWAAAGNAPRRRLGKLEQELLALGMVPMPDEITAIAITGWDTPNEEQVGSDEEDEGKTP